MSNHAQSTSQLASSLKWELLGDDVVALDIESGRVFRLTDHSAVVARHLLTGESHPYDQDEYEYVIGALLEEGLVETNDEVLVARSTFLRMGAAAALGVTILLLPSAAAAGSTVDPQTNGQSNPTPIPTGNTDTITVLM